MRTIVIGIKEKDIQNIIIKKELNTLAIVKTERTARRYRNANIEQLIALADSTINIDSMRSIEGIEAITATQLNKELNILDFDCETVKVNHAQTYTLVSLECNSKISNKVPTMSEWSILLSILFIMVVAKNNLKHLIRSKYVNTIYI